MVRPSDNVPALGKGARNFLICLERATVRSVVVSVADEGGLNGATKNERDMIFQKLVWQIDQLSECRVLIRFAREESFRVNLATTNLQTGLPELLIRF